MAPQTVLDCVVVGAGPAGLGASAALSAGGVEHAVLERGRPPSTCGPRRSAASSGAPASAVRAQL